MTRRRLGWALPTAGGLLGSAGAPIRWSLTRPVGTVGAGVAESLADSTPAPIAGSWPPKPFAASVPAPPAVPLTGGGGFREDIASYKDNIAVTAVSEGAG